MSEATLQFEGFVQVRLATDPDPSDEPRGVSGWTHAVAGEPDLDRILVTSHADPRRVSRSHGPQVGVAVRSVVSERIPTTGHPLVGAEIKLLGAPKFEGRNWIVASDGQEPIDPFELRISAPSFELTKRDDLRDASGNPIPLYLATPEHLAKRIPTPEADAAAKAEIFAALGVAHNNPRAWRGSRRALLTADRQKLADAALPAAVALDRRITDLDEDGAALGTVGFRMRYRFALSGPGTASDPGGLLGGAAATEADWPIDFWVGGWDSDALCMYLRGTLTVPLA